MKWLTYETVVDTATQDVKRAWQIVSETPMLTRTGRRYWKLWTLMEIPAGGSNPRYSMLMVYHMYSGSISLTYAFFADPSRSPHLAVSIKESTRSGAVVELPRAVRRWGTKFLCDFALCLRSVQGTD
jgi:hypothetical protein